jgi:hypothetical protein
MAERPIRRAGVKQAALTAKAQALTKKSVAAARALRTAQERATKIGAAARKARKAAGLRRISPNEPL